MSNPTRRDFLKLSTTGLLTVSGLLGLAGLFRFLEYQNEPAPRIEFDLGPQADYPPGSHTLLPDVPAVLFHGDGGFTALSLVCTHLGCTAEQVDNGFACPCHGSQYSQDGRVVRGPAQKPLRALRLELASNDHLILHTD